MPRTRFSRPSITCPLPSNGRSLGVVVGSAVGLTTYATGTLLNKQANLERLERVLQNAQFSKLADTICRFEPDAPHTMMAQIPSLARSCPPKMPSRIEWFFNSCFDPIVRASQVTRCSVLQSFNPVHWKLRESHGMNEKRKHVDGK